MMHLTTTLTGKNKKSGYYPFLSPFVSFSHTNLAKILNFLHMQIVESVQYVPCNTLANCNRYHKKLYLSSLHRN
jgi:F0F1-type ATP synthase beta subunit